MARCQCADIVFTLQPAPVMLHGTLQFAFATVFFLVSFFSVPRLFTFFAAATQLLYLFTGYCTSASGFPPAIHTSAVAQYFAVSDALLRSPIGTQLFQPPAPLLVHGCKPVCCRRFSASAKVPLRFADVVFS